MKSTDYAPRSAAMDVYIIPGMIGVEIGVDVGAHAEAMLLLGVGKLYLVDPWKNERAMGYCEGRLARWFNRVEYLQIDSHKAAKAFDVQHFAYIDIEHDYETVLQSLNDWWPKVSVMIGYRNYGRGGVAKAVDEFVAANKIRTVVDDYHNEIILFK
jgi:hypothetical protein